MGHRPKMARTVSTRFVCSRCKDMCLEWSPIISIANSKQHFGDMMSHHKITCHRGCHKFGGWQAINLGARS